MCLGNHFELGDWEIVYSSCDLETGQCEGLCPQVLLLFCVLGDDERKYQDICLCGGEVFCTPSCRCIGHGFM